MTPADDSAAYRDIIDRLVDSCLRGQGHIARHRVIEGVWHQYVDDIVSPQTPGWMLESSEELATRMRAVNDLLARLNVREREALARLLDQQYVAGVHDTLVVLHETETPPFDAAYEGTPFHDFVGRLDDWEWPTDRARP